MSAVQRGFQVKGLLTYLGDFLSTQDQSRFSCVNKTTSHAIDDCVSNLGELTALEAASKVSYREEYFRTKRIQNLKLNSDQIIVIEGNSFAIKNRNAYLNQGGFCTRLAKKIKFYSGYHHQQIARCFLRMVEQRTAQAEQLYKTPPKTIQQMRNRFFRLHHFAQEMAALKSTLEADQKNLYRSRNALCCLTRAIYRFVNYCKFSTTISQIQPHYVHLMGNPDDYKNRGMLAAVTQGKSGETPDADLGILVGKTHLPSRADPNKEVAVGVYAKLSSYSPVSEPSKILLFAKVCFSLSPIDREKGKPSPQWGTFSIDRQWQYGDSSVNNTGEHFMSLEHHKGELSKPYLAVDAVYDYYGRVGQNDRPAFRKLTQIAVEILLEENAEKAKVGTGHDESHVWISAGFSSYRIDHIRQRIAEAREKGKLFPDYCDESSFSVELDRQKAESTVVDFGKEKQTWQQIIESSPILFGKGLVLPKYFYFDPARYAVKKWHVVKEQS